MVTTAVLDNGL